MNNYTFKLPKNVSVFFYHSSSLVFMSYFPIVMSSWDPKGAQELPGCMKFALGKILDSYETITNMLHQEEKYRMTYLRYFVSYLCPLHILFFWFSQ